MTRYRQRGLFDAAQESSLFDLPAADELAAIASQSTTQDHDAARDLAAINRKGK